MHKMFAIFNKMYYLCTENLLQKYIFFPKYARKKQKKLIFI